MAKSRRRQANRAGKAPATDQATSGTPGSATATSKGASGAAVVPPRPAADPRAAERIRRQQERAAARRRHEMQRRIRTALIALGVVVLLGAGLIWLLSNRTEPPGEQVAIVQPFSHVADGTKITSYNTTPPTSGQHYSAPANSGVHTEPIPNEVQPHNLEHGQIIIQYTCDCPDIAAQLAEFSRTYGQWVIVAPYPNEQVGAPIVLTAWGAIMKLDSFDRDQITRFIDYYKNRGPEKVFSD